MKVELKYYGGPHDGRIDVLEVNEDDKLPPETRHLPLPISATDTRVEGVDPTVPSVIACTYRVTRVLGSGRIWIYNYAS